MGPVSRPSKLLQHSLHSKQAAGVKHDLRMEQVQEVAILGRTQLLSVSLQWRPLPQSTAQQWTSAWFAGSQDALPLAVSNYHRDHNGRLAHRLTTGQCAPRGPTLWPRQMEMKLKEVVTLIDSA
jgi:hypothetical protein